MRFLIVRLSSLGDVVCTLPAATALKAAFPEAHLTWAVDPRFRAIPECCSDVDEVVAVKPGWNPSTWPRIDGEFDAVLDLQGLSKSALVAARAKSNLKLGFHWQREGAWIATHPVLPDPTSIHVVDQYVDVARAAIAALGGPDRDGGAVFGLAPSPDDVASVEAKLRERGVEGPYVLFNPGAGWATKRWPPQHFASLVDALWKTPFPPVALGGGAAIDHAAYDEVAALCKAPPVKMTGATGVRELIALVSGATAHVGGDTGSTHLAVALGVRAIGLYSITRPERTGPYGQLEACFYDPAGLHAIEPDRVLVSIHGILPS